MHQALLIDEILEDPALDRVWWRLASFKPLLDLIPGLLSSNYLYIPISDVYIITPPVSSKLYIDRGYKYILHF
ncbi:hypothetical protein LENED_002003 [Lentinula edodes]|uniref:Uncharacterized protein n=1 Tax=Lentinula edodes TaxID=5353 RepID=A0A1Q3E0E9_LENED|nr:hypothetical protein LENED_002003 [Lentinula edodes]